MAVQQRRAEAIPLCFPVCQVQKYRHVSQPWPPRKQLTSCKSRAEQAHFVKLGRGTARRRRPSHARSKKKQLRVSETRRPQPTAGGGAFIVRASAHAPRIARGLTAMRHWTQTHQKRRVTRHPAVGCPFPPANKRRPSEFALIIVAECLW